MYKVVKLIEKFKIMNIFIYLLKGTISYPTAPKLIALRASINLVTNEQYFSF